ncbi:MAG: hypothetical protein ABJA60_02775 [Nitrosospira sp.]
MKWSSAQSAAHAAEIGGNSGHKRDPSDDCILCDQRGKTDIPTPSHVAGAHAPSWLSAVASVALERDSAMHHSLRICSTLTIAQSMGTPDESYSCNQNLLPHSKMC